LFTAQKLKSSLHFHPMEMSYAKTKNFKHQILLTTRFYYIHDSINQTLEQNAATMMSTPETVSRGCDFFRCGRRGTGNTRPASTVVRRVASQLWGSRRARGARPGATTGGAVRGAAEAITHDGGQLGVKTCNGGRGRRPRPSTRSDVRVHQSCASDSRQHA
jgi:hypothetical protein